MTSQERAENHGARARPALVLAGDRGADRRKAWVRRPGGSVRARRGRNRVGRNPAPWRRDANVGDVGQFLRALERPFGKPALGVGLEPPGDTADQILLVPAAHGFAEDLGVPLLELADRHLLERRELLGEVWFHASSPSARIVNPRVPSDTLSLVSRESSRRFSPVGADF